MSKDSGVVSHTVVRFGYWALAIGVTLCVLYCMYLLFVPLLASVLLTFVLDPVVDYFERRGLKRFWVIVGMYVFVVLAAAATVYFVLPRLVIEARTFAGDIPHYRAMIVRMLQTAQATIQDKFPQLPVPDLYQVLRARMPGAGTVDVDAFVAYTSSFFSILSVVVIVPIVTFFLLADGHLIRKALLRMVPNRYFEMFFLLFHKITSALKFFIRGQCIDALAVGVMTAVGLAAIQLPYAIVIGIIAGLGNLIPYLGPIIGFLPAFFVVLVSPEGLTMWMLAKVIGVFALVQFIEGTFIYPIAVGKSVDLHPLVVIIGITVGGQLGGILGMLIAIPVISVAKVSLEVLHSNLKSYSII
ncbi:MAG: AI-2E family transporter [Chitinivibrionales bacterium]|nr:AI-2E family transporter [Chitinivibrionales bacterium]MBD3396648.1 AI-2E family transporter [Chitinivibrionales bacterium]